MGIDKNLALKPFRKGDLFVYAIIFAVIITLFIFLTPRNDQTGFCVYLDGEKVMEYYYETEKAVIYDSEKVSEVEDGSFIVYSLDGYNVLSVQNDSVKVIETDCGLTKECTKMTLDMGSIICAPHNMVIYALGEDIPPRVG